MTARLRIVVADDERPARSFLLALLRSFPDVAVVGEAVSGREAVALIEKEKPDLALKGENADVPTEVSRPKPQTPDVVVLNPGMADQKGNSPTQASAQAKTPPADTDVSRRDVTGKKADDHRLSTSRRPMRGYQDLRDYVLKR